jgi:hypothetical protein
VERFAEIFEGNTVSGNFKEIFDCVTLKKYLSFCVTSLFVNPRALYMYAQALQSLVDYDEDSDEENSNSDSEEDGNHSSSKRLKLT